MDKEWMRYSMMLYGMNAIVVLLKNISRECGLVMRGTKHFCFPFEGAKRGKRIYFDEEEAFQKKRQCEGERGVALFIYQCEKCKMWHLTSQPEKGNNQRELAD